MKKKIALVTAALAITTYLTPAVVLATPMYRNIGRAAAEAAATGIQTARACLGYVDADVDGVCDNRQANGGDQQGARGNGVCDGTGPHSGNGVCDGTGGGNGRGACDGTGGGHGRCGR